MKTLETIAKSALIVGVFWAGYAIGASREVQYANRVVCESGSEYTDDGSKFVSDPDDPYEVHTFRGCRVHDSNGRPIDVTVID